MGMSYTGINTFLYVDTCVCPHEESQQCNCTGCELIKERAVYGPVFPIFNSVLITPPVFLASVVHAFMQYGLPF